MAKEGSPVVTLDPVDAFLKERGVTRPVIMISNGRNGHDYSQRWVGETVIDINDGKVNWQKIEDQDLTGCLTTTQKDFKITRFIKSGQVVKTDDSRHFTMIFEKV